MNEIAFEVSKTMFENNAGRGKVVSFCHYLLFMDLEHFKSHLKKNVGCDNLSQPLKKLDFLELFFARSNLNFSINDRL